MKQIFGKWTAFGRKGLALLLVVVMMAGLWMPAYAESNVAEPTEVTEPVAQETTPVEPEETAVPENTVAPEETVAPEITVEEPVETLVPEAEPEVPVPKTPGAAFHVIKRGAAAASTQGKLEFNKTATLREDGDYNLELTLKGSVGSETNKTKLDLIIVLDRSASMENYDRIGKVKTAAKTLITAVEGNESVDARYNIIDFAGNIWGEVDEHEAVLGTAWQRNESTKRWTKKNTADLGWTDSSNATKYITNHVRTREYNDAGTYINSSCTNYEAAFREINTQMKKARKDAVTAVVFMSDGLPTARFTRSGAGNTVDGRTDFDGYGTSYEYNTLASLNAGAKITFENVTNCYNAATDEMKALSPSRFYVVVTGSANPESTENSNNLSQANLNKVKAKASDVVNGMLKNVNGGYEEVFAVDSSDLAKAFKSIAAQLTELFYTNVTVTDILRHQSGELMVDLVPDAEIGIAVYNGATEIANSHAIAASGTSLNLPATEKNEAATLKATYDSEKHQLDLIFPSDYKLEPEYTYKLYTVIRPTERAYQEFRKNDGYIIPGDDEDNPTGTPGEGNTGTHSGQLGFRANDSAVVDYVYEGAGKEEAYMFPVVQLHPGTLVVKKTFEGLTDEEIQSLDMSFDVEITYPADTSNGKTEGIKENYKLALKEKEGHVVMTKNADGSYSWSVKNLSPETTYVVTEKGGNLEGFDMSTSTTTTSGTVAGKTADGSVGKNETVTVAYNNKYEVSVTKASVTKLVTGNMGDRSKAFNFTASLSGRTNSMIGVEFVKNDSGVPEVITTETFDFTLKHGETIVFTKVPLGAELTVSENAEDYTLTKVDVTNVPDGEAAEMEGTSVSLVMSNVDNGHDFTFINDKTVLIDTGIMLDSLPYFVILSVVAVAGVLLFLRKRKVQED